jgi:NTE family protein
MSNGGSASLVLGSGGARGLAHIGVIECLEERGFEIASIAGTSMGALVGGIYASGKLETYTRWVTALEKMDVLRLLDPSFSRNSLFKGERIISVLKDLIGDHNIEDLPVSFTAVATDLDRGKEVWLNHGSLFNAVRASIAIPTVFAPYHYKGKRLVDGGLVNPIPIAPTLRDATDLTIAVNLSAKERPAPEHKPRSAPDSGSAGDYRARIGQFVEELQARWGQQETDELGLFDVISKTMDTMQNTIARLKLAAYSPDIVIDIPRNSCTFYEFHRARELIEIGYHNAQQALHELDR